MSTYLYDEALKNKIQDWIKDKRIKVMPREDVNRLFLVEADEGKDKAISLPLITISKDPNMELDLTTKRSLTYDGKVIAVSEDGSKSLQLNAIPISLNYQLDVYAEKYIEADSYIREFVFKFVNYPKLKIELPYNGAKIEQVANIKLLPSITDNSDIPERLFPGQFTRLTLQLELEDAYLFSIPVKDNYSIDLNPDGNYGGLDTSVDVLENVDYSVEVLDKKDESHNGFTHLIEEI